MRTADTRFNCLRICYKPYWDQRTKNTNPLDNYSMTAEFFSRKTNTFIFSVKYICSVINFKNRDFLFDFIRTYIPGICLFLILRTYIEPGKFSGKTFGNCL